MVIDPATIELTLPQKQRLAELAEQSGKDCATVVDELLSSAPSSAILNGNGSGPKNLLEAFEAIGAVGCFEGPVDLSTNPKYLEGFGTNARRHAD